MKMFYILILYDAILLLLGLIYLCSSLDSSLKYYIPCIKLLLLYKVYGIRLAFVQK